LRDLRHIGRTTWSSLVVTSTTPFFTTTATTISLVSLPILLSASSLQTDRTYLANEDIATHQVLLIKLVNGALCLADSGKFDDTASSRTSITASQNIRVKNFSG
jgi:hypothetical protein